MTFLMQRRGIISGLVGVLVILCMLCNDHVLAQPRHAPLTMPRQRIIQSCGAVVRSKNSTTAFSLSTIVGLTSLGRVQASSSRTLLGFWMPYKLITDVEEASDVVAGPRIWSWPNPFRDDVNIELLVPFIESVHADIYNNHGSHVGRIRTGTINPDGAILTWNGLDSSGDPVANGLYTLRITIRQFTRQTSSILSATILCNR